MELPNWVIPVVVGGLVVYITLVIVHNQLSTRLTARENLRNIAITIGVLYLIGLQVAAICLWRNLQEQNAYVEANCPVISAEQPTTTEGTTP